MNKSMLIALSLVLSGCGTTYVDSVDPSPSPSPSGEPGKIAPAPSPSATPTPEPFTLEGYHTLQNGGYADIVEDAQGLFTVRSLRVSVKNADGTWAVLPLASTSPLAAINGVVYLTQAMTYVPATHNMKDSSNTLLSGSYSTQVRFFKAGGLLAIRVTITSSNTVLMDNTQ